ncbi:MAG: PaaI family thioesterase, partial [Desulfobacteraceae bacterium]
MRKLNPAYVAAASKIANACSYFVMTSMEMKELEWGRCRIEAKVLEKHMQPFGVVHGGVFAGLVDAAAFWAVYSQVDEALGMTTVDLKVNYLAPASKGILIA